MQLTQTNLEKHGWLFSASLRLMVRAGARVLLAASTHFEGHGGHADDGGQGGHQDGPQAHPAGRNHGILHRDALIFQTVGKLHD